MPVEWVYGYGGWNGLTAIFISRDRKWPRVTKCTHSRVVGLRLKGNLLLVKFAFSTRGTVPLFHTLFWGGSLNSEPRNLTSKTETSL